MSQNEDEAQRRDLGAKRPNGPAARAQRRRDSIGYNTPAPRYTEFRQKVRRHRPSELLPVIARITAHMQPAPFDDVWRMVSPWACSAIGRESLLYGSEHRSQAVDQASLRRIFNAWNLAHDDNPDGVDVTGLLTGILHEQFPYMTSPKSEITRSYLMMADARLPVAGVGAEDWVGVLGTSLDDAIRASFLLWTGAGVNDGTYNPRWVQQENFAEVNTFIPADVTTATADRLTATVAQARADAADVEAKRIEAGLGKLPPHLASYAYNPLTRTPIIDLGPTVRVAPQRQFILQAAMPDSLYYAGIQKFDRDFSTRLGNRVEAYAGWQLQHSGLLQVYPEIVYDNAQRSVDWFVVLPDAVVLIECKSARLSLDARSGSAEPLQAVINRHVGKARRQIKRTVEKIRSGHHQFAAIPADRNMFGLIVTSEPFYTANLPSVTSTLPSPGIPTMAVSLRDVELLSSLNPQEFEQVMHDVVADEERSTWGFPQAVRSVHPTFVTRPNRLIDDTFDSQLLPLSFLR